MVTAKFVLVPFVIVALVEASVGAVKLAIVPLKALSVVPEAVAKPNHAVEVPLVKVRFVAVPFAANNVETFAVVMVPVV